jgi:hypothetical protein
VHTTPNSKDGTTPSWMRHRPSSTPSRRQILGATARLRYVAKHESAGNTFDFIDDDDGKTKPWTFVVMHNTADALEKMTAGA